MNFILVLSIYDQIICQNLTKNHNDFYSIRKRSVQFSSLHPQCQRHHPSTTTTTKSMVLCIIHLQVSGYRIYVGDYRGINMHHNFRLVSTAVGFGSSTITNTNANNNDMVAAITVPPQPIWMVWVATVFIQK